MKVENLRCKDVIQNLQKQLKLQNINVIFDAVEVVRQQLQIGGHIVFFNVIEDVSEKEKYEKKPENIQTHYKTKSPTIHFPDLKIGELINVYQCGIGNAYKKTCNVIDPIEMIVEMPIEIKFVYFLFLHEVGHWHQLMEMNRNVKQFIEADIDAERENHEAQNLIMERVIKRNKVKSLLEKEITLTDDELQKLNQLEIEYRNIPKEFDADEYAKKTLKEINNEKIMYMNN